MPVVATMTIISLRRAGGRGNDLPFTSPATLRSLLEDALANQPDAPFQQALAIADKLEALWSRYYVAVESAIDTYIEESTRGTTGAPELIERFEPIDRERLKTMKEVIALRQSLFALLSEKQWNAVFK